MKQTRTKTIARAMKLALPVAGAMLLAGCLSYPYQYRGDGAYGYGGDYYYGQPTVDYNYYGSYGYYGYGPYGGSYYGRRSPYYGYGGYGYGGHRHGGWPYYGGWTRYPVVVVRPGPGHDPNPGTNPGTDPGTDPGTNPGTNPGTDPGTNPGPGPGIDLPRSPDDTDRLRNTGGRHPTPILPSRPRGPGISGPGSHGPGISGPRVSGPRLDAPRVTAPRSIDVSRPDAGIRQAPATPPRAMPSQRPRVERASPPAPRVQRAQRAIPDRDER